FGGAPAGSHRVGRIEACADAHPAAISVNGEFVGKKAVAWRCGAWKRRFPAGAFCRIGGTDPPLRRKTACDLCSAGFWWFVRGRARRTLGFYTIGRCRGKAE